MVSTLEVVWLHLGVAANQVGFKLEERAINGTSAPSIGGACAPPDGLRQEATFGCPDERGWVPSEQRVLPHYPLYGMLCVDEETFPAVHPHTLGTTR